MNVTATSSAAGSRVGAASRFYRFRKVDGRSETGRRLRSIQRELTDHLGGPGNVTAPMRLLIERVAVDIVRLAMLDAEMLDGTFSEHDQRVAHALRNSVRLALREIGFTKRAAPTKTLDDIRREIAAASQAATMPRKRRTA